MSAHYAAQVQARLDAASEGQPLNGAEEPTVSAPPTARGKRRRPRGATPTGLFDKAGDP